MTTVLDTHAWYWWRIGSDRLSAQARRVIDDSDRLSIPAVCCWEIALLVELGRLRLDRSLALWLTQALDVANSDLEPISPAIVVRALDVRRYFGGGDPVDHLVAATALALDAPLVSADARLAEFPGLRVVW